MINNDNNLLIANCPGFGDTKGTEQEIINAFAIDCLLDSFSSNNNRTKILLVISVAEINANRDEDAFENFKRIEKIFPNEEQLKNYVGVIITKSDPNWDGSDYFDQLNDDPPENGRGWCSYFYEHPEKVFTLPKASVHNINQVYEYENIDEFLSLLSHDQIENLVHKIALSSTADAVLKKWEMTIHQNINDIIEEIF